MRCSSILVLTTLVFGCSQTDEDGDGFSPPVDCDDTSATTRPTAPEICNGVDDNCDGRIDEAAIDAFPTYVDSDGDGYGAGMAVLRCSVDGEWSDRGNDCDDRNPAIYPQAAEQDCADPVDYNCDGSVAFEDRDGDGYPACEDCDDRVPTVSPAALERCNDIDDDCDGQVDDDALDALIGFVDQDGDGYGDAQVAGCTLPPGAVHIAGDCTCVRITSRLFRDPS